MCYGMRCKYERWSGECSFGGTRFPPDAACMENEVLPVVNCEKCPYEVTGGDCQGECFKEIEELEGS